MTEDAGTQGPQALVLRSLLTAQPLPGTSYPARLGDLRLTLDETGAVRLLRGEFDDDTLDQLGADMASAGGPAVAVLTVPELTAADDGLPAAVRSRAERQPEGTLRVTVEVCGVRDGVLHPWEQCVVELTRAGPDWVAVGPPTTLST